MKFRILLNLNKQAAIKAFLLIAALFLSLLASLFNVINSELFSLPISLCLALAALTGVAIFYRRSLTGCGFNRSDLYSIVFILGIFAILYLPLSYYIPHQINSDEIAITLAARRWIEAPGFPDLWSLRPDYFYFPGFSFILYGSVAEAFGDINLITMRLANSAFGLLIIASGYFLFRHLFSSRFASALATLLLGSHHALLAISRMAMRDNSALLVMTTSLAFLWHGVKHQSRLSSYLGGIVLGLSLYVYYPARVAVALWLFFALASLTIFYRNPFWFSKLKRSLLPTFIGFFIVAMPMVAVSFRFADQVAGFQKQQLLLYEEGRVMQQHWVGAATISEGVRKSIINGLTLFNNKVNDQGYIYPNYGHGFADPLTGILVWIGFGAVLFSMIFTKRKIPGKFFMALSFFTLMIIFSLVANKAPNYTRSLIIIPFMAYMTTHGILSVRKCAASFLRLKVSRRAVDFFEKKMPFDFYRLIAHLSTLLMAGLISTIFIWNLKIFGDFVKKGFNEGNDLGGTARLVMERKNLLPYTFVLIADQAHPYYSWGEQYQWRVWIEFFVSEGQNVQIASPEEWPDFFPPFTLFMNRGLWEERKTDLVRKYPKWTIHNIKSDGSLLAFEVQ